MKKKFKLFDNDAYASIEKLFPSGMYLVECRGSNGEMLDKMRCDDYQNALAYYKAFCKLAKNS